MKKWVVRTGPLIASAALGCSGAGNWSATCGCAELYLSVGQEVTIPNSKGVESFTPEAVQAWFTKRFKNQNVDLKDLRALGSLSDAWCAESLHQLRCVYWLWGNGEAYRGIEVTVINNWVSHDARFRARYVVERQ